MAGGGLSSAPRIEAARAVTYGSDSAINPIRANQYFWWRVPRLEMPNVGFARAPAPATAGRNVPVPHIQAAYLEA
jgi:hypothetical protein